MLPEQFKIYSENTQIFLKYFLLGVFWFVPVVICAFIFALKNLMTVTCSVE